MTGFAFAHSVVPSDLLGDNFKLIQQCFLEILHIFTYFVYILLDSVYIGSELAPQLGDIFVGIVNILVHVADLAVQLALNLPLALVDLIYDTLIELLRPPVDGQHVLCEAAMLEQRFLFKVDKAALGLLVDRLQISPSLPVDDVLERFEATLD